MNGQTYDLLVIGSGIAGLSFALEMAEVATVMVVTKKDRAESATNYAQGGIAAAIGSDDSIDLHIQDTLRTGSGLSNEETVNIVASEGPDKIRRLIEWGAQFTADGSNLSLGREGGHSKHRIVHTADHTGREVERALIEALKKHPKVQLWENAQAIDLVTDRHLEGQDVKLRSRRCYGAYVLNSETGSVELVKARLTLLATGGMGCVWTNTTNPSIATGDGVAMAWRASARIANLEFMQFHPTSFYNPDREGRAFLITEAVRGYGGILFNDAGERFMEGYPLKELEPRDLVARAIDSERKRLGIDHVWLDVTHLDGDKLKDRFPMIYETLLKDHHLDITKSPIPVVPAAHYQCGGVYTDEHARTTLDRLLAAGEVAHTGLHGANRLASNSLLEAVVFSSRASKEAKKILEESKGEELPAFPEWNDAGTYDPDEWVLIRHDLREIQVLMEDYVGIVRSDLRLKRAARRLATIAAEVEDYWRRTRVSAELVELRNIAQIARLIVKCARSRKESRGLHFTTDYPHTDTILGARDTII